MGWATVRRFEWKATDEDEPTLLSVTPMNQLRRIPIRLAEVLLVNALALPMKGHKIRFGTALNELSLVSSFLVDSGDKVRLLAAPFGSSSSHIRRFISESAGLGMLTEVVRAGQSLGHERIHHFDSLPTSIAKQFPRKGSRPDLLFRFAHDAILAGEARGRSGRNPPQTVGADPRKRIESLLSWTRKHAPLIVTYAYLTPNGTTIDLYFPDGGSYGFDGPLGEPGPPPVAEEMRRRAGTVEAPLVPRAAFEVEDRPETAVDPSPPPQRPDRGQADPVSPAQLLEAGLGTRHRLEQDLYDSAPRRDVLFSQANLRFSWARADLVGGEHGAVLLGVLDTPLTRDDDAALARLEHRLADMHFSRRETDQPASPTVASQGRLLVAHSPGGRVPDEVITG